jgi:hypothetical protein
MKTEYHSIEAELETAEWPLDPEIIANRMEIEVKDIEGMSWTRKYDGQLISLTIHFKTVYIPKDECE